MKQGVKCQKECPKWSLFPQSQRRGGSAALAKCCDFNPFVSAFRLGAWLAQGGSQDELRAWGEGKALWSLLGLLQPQEGSSVRCLLFHSEKGLCRIWQHRPPVCRGYFCEVFSQKLQKQGAREEALKSQEEAQWLALWWFEKGPNCKDLWDQWVMAMETPRAGASLPEEFLFKDPKRAFDHYVRLYHWQQTQLASLSACDRHAP